MASPAVGETLRPEHRATVDMIRIAFPGGVPDESYRPLLALLYERMSFRAVATVVAFCTGKSYPAVYNDVLGAVGQADEGKLETQAVERTRQALRRSGYDEWLSKPD